MNGIKRKVKRNERLESVAASQRRYVIFRKVEMVQLRARGQILRKVQHGISNLLQENGVKPQRQKSIKVLMELTVHLTQRKCYFKILKVSSFDNKRSNRRQSNSATLKTTE